MNGVICKIETTLPEICETGIGRLHVIRGYCFHLAKRTSRTRGLALRLGDELFPIAEFEDFRPDVAVEFAARDEVGSSVTSGFFGAFEAAPKLAGTTQSLALALNLEDGSCEHVDIGRVRFLAPQAAPAQVPAARLAICLATWNPEPAAFARQIDTLIAQDFSDWVCIVNDDFSAKALYQRIREICARDPRIHLFRNTRNLGFYRNFETALQRVPAGCEFVALCDQDDMWNADKLSACVAAFKAETQLVYCDMRIVEESGAVVSPSYWTSRRNQYRDLEVLISANTVTGAASVFRASLLGRVLPFPDRVGAPFHDHWIACCALAGGGIEYIDRPLYDYVQHGGNVIGHANFDKLPTLLQRAKVALQGLTEPRHIRMRLGARRFAALDVVNSEYRRLHLIAKTLWLRFAGRSGLPGLQSLDSSLSLFLKPNPLGLALALRHFSPRFARDTTGNAELRLGWALAVRRLNQIYVRTRAPNIVARIRKATAPTAAEPAKNGQLPVLAEKTAPIVLKIDPAAPRRINILIPEINFQNFFGGYMGKFNLARKLAEQGYRVRMVIVDWCDMQTEQWRTLINRFDGLGGFFNYVEVAYCYDRTQPLTVNPEDRFIASTWWTAHIANDAMRQLGSKADDTGFVYLIQEYEPFTFPMGTLYAVADQSYSFRHRALFSTGLLEEFFRDRGIGVFAPNACGQEGALHFENAILNFEVNRNALVQRRPRKLLFYARPEAHAARNMFDVGMLALERAIAAGAFADGPWEFHGVGTSPARIELGAGNQLKILGKLSLDEYQSLLPQYDIGLSLMYTPHPSLVPLEMAAAGMLSVTNTCLNKTAEKLAMISSNLVAAAPTVDGVAVALAAAARRVGDIDARIRGSRVNWASNWDAAFNDDLMQRIGAWLGPLVK